MVDKQVIEFGTNEVGTLAESYRARIAASKGVAAPVGGVPMPKMPRLDQPPTGDAFSGVQRPRPTPASVGVGGLLLTEEELRSPGVRQGVGAAYAANQPPQSPVPEGPMQNPPRPEGGLRPETVAQLNDLAQAQDPVATLPASEKSLIDEFDLENFGIKTKSLLNNKARRNAIEARITDTINVEDLFIHYELRQMVPIIPGKFFPTYRSVPGTEDIWVKRQMGSETGSDAYMMSKYAMMNLCCGLFSINDMPLPSHLSQNGQVDEKAFDIKLARMLKLPASALEDLHVNFMWFLRRVEKLLIVDELKGF